MRWRRLSIAPAVLALVMLGACGSSAPSPGSSPTPVPLSSRFPASIPGFDVQPEGTLGSGPSDITKAATDDGAPDATQALTAAGYSDGYLRNWSDSSSTRTLYIYLFAFGSAPGAQKWQQHLVQEVNTAAAHGGTLTVSGIPGAAGYTSTLAGQPLLTIAFARGRYVAEVSATGSGVNADLATSVAMQEFGLLPSS
jgi:hypothetical protein